VRQTPPIAPKSADGDALNKAMAFARLSSQGRYSPGWRNTQHRGQAMPYRMLSPKAAQQALEHEKIARF
jgi:hypothetical protein